MTVIGTPISASDTEALRTKILMLVGVGAGDLGYGQNIGITGNLTNATVKPNAWPDYKAALSLASDHQTAGAADTSEARFKIPVADGLQRVKADSIDLYDIEADNLTAVRMLHPNNSMTLYNNVFASARGAWWGPLATITSEIDLLWATEDKARYFFNTGGDVRIKPSQPSWSYITRYWTYGRPYTLRSGGYWWNIGLPLIGTIVMDAHHTTSNGSTGIPTLGIGYYELSSSYQLIFNGANYYNPYAYIPGYPDIDDFYVEAAKVPNGIRFKVTFTEANHDQQVDPGTRVDFSLLRATTYMINPPIDFPQFITRKAF